MTGPSAGEWDSAALERHHEITLSKRGYSAKQFMLSEFKPSDLYEELAPSHGEDCLIFVHHAWYERFVTMSTGPFRRSFALGEPLSLCFNNSSIHPYLFSRLPSMIERSGALTRRIIILVPSYDDFRYGVLWKCVSTSGNSLSRVSAMPSGYQMEGEISRLGYSSAFFNSVVIGIIYRSISKLQKSNNFEVSLEAISGIAMAISDVARSLNAGWQKSLYDTLLSRPLSYDEVFRELRPADGGIRPPSRLLSNVISDLNGFNNIIGFRRQSVLEYLESEMVPVNRFS